MHRSVFIHFCGERKYGCFTYVALVSSFHCYFHCSTNEYMMLPHPFFSHHHITSAPRFFCAESCTSTQLLHLLLPPPCSFLPSSLAPHLRREGTGVKEKKLHDTANQRRILFADKCTKVRTNC